MLKIKHVGNLYWVVWIDADGEFTVSTSTRSLRKVKADLQRLRERMGHGRVHNAIRRGPPKGHVPPQLRRYLFKKGHR